MEKGEKSVINLEDSTTEIKRNNPNFSTAGKYDKEL